MVRRLQKITLNTVAVTHGVLDDKETTTSKQVMAHVTEVNGAQVQNNIFGKEYAHTWVARIHGEHQADSVTFNDTTCQVLQVRKHATRTDIYFGKDLEANSNVLD